MPTYDFKDVETGEPVELVFSMSDAPRIGETAKVDGREFRRVVSRPNQPLIEREIQFKMWSKSGPEEAPGAPRYDPVDGCPVFASKAEVKAFLRHQHEHGRPQAEYGDGFDRIRP